MNVAIHNKQKPEQTKDLSEFWLVCRVATLADALYALYYLPRNYKLMVLDTSSTQSLGEAANHTELIDRIQFEPSTGLPEAFPISFGYALITAGPEDSQSLVITNGASDDSQQDAYVATVPTGSPPALASAIHDLVRTMS